MQPVFSWLDHFLFVLMLLVSAIVGVYYGFFRQQKTVTDYLLGGKQMGIWPISMSLVSSSLSGLVLLSVPADIYRYGIMFCFVLPTTLFGFIIGYYVYIPVFYKLQTTSIYEYLDIRFNHKVRSFASVLFTINVLLSLPIVIYIPALALGQVTNIDAHYITPLVCGICIFYTTFGGIKAVVWTDAIQFIVMVGSLIVVVFVGIWRVGGLGNILETAAERNRLQIDFDMDFLKRDTFWTGTIAALFTVISHYICSQSFVQKCLALPSLKSVKRAMILAVVGFIFIFTCCIFAGLILFAKYSNCDPVKRKIIDTYDKLLPMFVMEELSFLPGLAGLFIAGIFSAALSTLSASMNCLAATVYEDFVSPFVSKETSEERISIYLKLLVVIIGVFSTGCVYIVEKLGSLIALTFSFSGVTAGPLIGLFSAGMLLPSINSKGALCGGVTSLLLMSWIIMTSQWYKLQNIVTYPVLHVTTDGCNSTVNILNKTLSTAVPVVNTTTVDLPFVLYRISFYWYTFMGVLIVVIVGLVVSYFFKEDKQLNKDCISPVVRFLLTNQENENSSTQYDTIDRALVLINKS